MIPLLRTTSSSTTTDVTTIGRSRPRRALAASLAAVTLLAACGSDDDAESTASTLEPATADDVAETDEGDGEEGSDDATTEPGSADTTTTTTTTEPPAGGTSGSSDGSAEGEPVETTTTDATTTTTTEPPAGGTDVACIVGQWRLRDQEFVDQLAAAVAADTGVGEVDWSYVSGDYLYDINPDGTTRGQRIAWTTRLSSPEGAIITTIDSDDSGTWTVDGSTISIVDEASTATVTTGLEIDGVVQPLPGGGQTVGTEGLSGSGTFECGADVITITLTDLPDAPPGGITATLEAR